MSSAAPVVRSSDGRGALAAALVGLAAFLVYGGVSLELFATYNCGMDLAIFDQAVRNLAHFRAPVSSMKSPGMNLFGDHFHPVLVLAAPFYWLWDDPRTLLLVQALCIGLTAAIVVATARRLYFRDRLLEPVALGLAFAFSYGVAHGAVFDFHEVALGMPLLALALAALLDGRRGWFLAACAAVLLVKEDAGILVFGLGMVAFVKGRRRIGALVMAASTAWTLLAIKVLIPSFSPTGTWAYASTVGGPGLMLRSAWRALVTDGGLTTVVLWLLVCLLFLPVRSWLLLALLPNLATRAVGANTSYWTIENHYNMLPAVVVAFAAMEVLGTKVRRQRAWGKALVVAAAVSLACGTVPSHVFHTLRGSRAAQADAALARVPAGTPVAADAYLTPHLTKDHPITQQVRPETPLGWAAFHDDLSRPLVADYIVLDRQTHAWRAQGPWVGQAIAWFTARGFHITHTVGDFVVLQHRQGAPG